MKRGMKSYREKKRRSGTSRLFLNNYLMKSGKNKKELGLLSRSGTPSEERRHEREREREGLERISPLFRIRNFTEKS